MERIDSLSGEFYEDGEERSGVLAERLGEGFHFQPNRDHLQTEWVQTRKQRGLEQLAVMAVALAASVITYGAASEALFWTMAESSLFAGASIGTLEVAAAAGAGAAAAMAGNATAQVLATGRLDAGNVLRSGLSGAISGALSGYYGNSYGLSRLAAEAAASCVGAAMNGGQCGEGAKSAFVTASLAWAGAEMRGAMIEDSKKFAGICDAQGNCLDNKSGTSVGVNGDRFKLAGGRVNLDLLCDGQRCETDPATGAWIFDDKGYVKLMPTDRKGLPIELPGLLATHPEWRSPMGGWQGALGRFAFFDYTPGSAWDRIAEAYAGPHDMLNSFIWYDGVGNIKTGVEGTLLGHIGNVMNYVNVLFATPFALGTITPQGSMSAITSGMQGPRRR